MDLTPGMLLKTRHQVLPHLIYILTENGTQPAAKAGHKNPTQNTKHIPITQLVNACSSSASFNQLTIKKCYNGHLIKQF